MESIKRNKNYAGLALAFLLQPFDVLKFALQIDPSHQKYNPKNQSLLKLVDIAKYIKTNETYAGFFRGALVNIVKTAASFCILQVMLKQLSKTGGKDKIKQFKYQSLIYFSKVLLTNPFEILYTRMSVVGFNNYEGMIDGALKILKEGAIFKGALTQTIGEGMAFFIGASVTQAIIQESMYNLARHSEEISDLYRKNFSVAIGSILGGTVSSVFTMPFQFVLARVRFSRFNKMEAQKCNGIYDCITKVYKHEGIRQFFRGLTPYTIKNIILLMAVNYIIVK
jgi:hypothetical protein